MIVFDLDETLVKINTQYFFAEAFFKKNKFSFFLYMTLSKGLLGKIVGYLAKDDPRRFISYKLFGFYKEEVLKKNARKIYLNAGDIFNCQVVTFFNKLKAEYPHKIVIVTATPGFIAENFRDIFEVPLYSTIYSNRKINLDLLRNKCTYIQELFGGLDLIVSDSVKDLECESEGKIFVNKGTMYWDENAMKRY